MSALEYDCVVFALNVPRQRLSLVEVFGTHITRKFVRYFVKLPVSLISKELAALLALVNYFFGVSTRHGSQRGVSLNSHVRKSAIECCLMHLMVKRYLLALQLDCFEERIESRFEDTWHRARAKRLFAKTRLFLLKNLGSHILNRSRLGLVLL